MLRHGSTIKRKPTFDDRWLQLLDAAAALFTAEGYEGASMRRLAREAKLSLSGVYHYVGSKEELLYWIQFNTFDSLLKGLQISLDGVVGPRERLQTAVLNHVRHFGKHMNELKVCAREIDVLQGEAYQEVHDRRKAYFDAVHALVKELPPQPEAPHDSWLATANLFGMLNWFYQWYDPQRSPVSLDDLAAQQTALFLRGYAAPSDDYRSDT
ncbi:MAG: TetR/AcrR family transcriptional regulator [Planctomycetota bacterium]|jgi:AcrR family transcriptional regulator